MQYRPCRHYWNRRSSVSGSRHQQRPVSPWCHLYYRSTGQDRRCLPVILPLPRHGHGCYNTVLIIVTTVYHHNLFESLFIFISLLFLFLWRLQVECAICCGTGCPRRCWPTRAWRSPACFSWLWLGQLAWAPPLSDRPSTEREDRLHVCM